MPDLTTKYQFEKATANENYDVGVHARNMDKLDDILFDTSTLFATTAGNNAYALAIPGITSYADMVGKLLLVKVVAGSTADVYFNVNGLGAKTCYKLMGGRVSSGDLLANNYYLFVCFDAVSGFSLLSESAKSVDLLAAQTLKNKTIDGENNTILNVDAGNVNMSDGSTVENKVMTHLADVVTDTDGVHGWKTESGTWTPVLAGATTPGINTYAKQNGYYEKYGNMILIHCRLQLSAKDAGMVGGIIISGLPFTAKSEANRRNALNIGYYSYIDTTGNVQITADIGNNTNYISLSICADNALISTLTVANITATTEIEISGIYNI